MHIPRQEKNVSTERCELTSHRDKLMKCPKQEPLSRGKTCYISATFSYHTFKIGDNLSNIWGFVPKGQDFKSFDSSKLRKKSSVTRQLHKCFIPEGKRVGGYVFHTWENNSKGKHRIFLIYIFTCFSSIFVSVFI